jgi:hypothetical protein
MNERQGRSSEGKKEDRSIGGSGEIELKQIVISMENYREKSKIHEYRSEPSTSVLTSASSSQRRLSPSDWSMRSESYIGRTNSLSVVAKRSALGVQM